ncbi:hypothetical protein SAMN04487895_103443 [Paenibacillus sophorae]|uniref:Uncharacterized protein n=1 Tax=Paenibacillus sophorae TaxID=1333845 RepID=A0A1H8KGV0_9BACL|nr:hypothetical protein SAMN04487895_103443 [Paenibacillus sophorae]
MIPFQDRFGPRRKRELHRLSDSLDTFYDIAVYMESICNANRIRKTFADPRMVHLGQVHDDSFRLQC